MEQDTATTPTGTLTKCTGDILDHHLAAIMEQDVDNILNDYTEQSVLFTQDGPITGLTAIRAFFERFICGAPPELFAALTITRLDIHGEVAYLVWKAEPCIALATDTFFIRDGTIVAQTFAMLAPQPA